MKMDAMLKRRMWKVAIAHFSLTILFGWGLLHSWLLAGKLFEPNEYAGFVAWSNCVLKGFILLQPQFWVAFKMGILHHESDLGFLAISIPFWSVCFSWIFVKLDNWLNHFPVLGKRVL